MRSWYNPLNWLSNIVTMWTTMRHDLELAKLCPGDEQVHAVETHLQHGCSRCQQNFGEQRS